MRLAGGSESEKFGMQCSFEKFSVFRGMAAPAVVLREVNYMAGTARHNYDLNLFRYYGWAQSP